MSQQIAEAIDLVFDESWYRGQAGDIGSSSAYRHYLEVGIARGLSPSPLFDTDHYGSAHPDIDFRRANPLEHYFLTPPDERADPHMLFDRAYYANAEPPLPPEVDPLVHYLTDREARRRPPHPLFDPIYYLERNPDVAAGGDLPLRHYIVSGWREGRSPHRLFDLEWYFRNDRALAGDRNPLTHYLDLGAAEGWSPNPLFDPNWYLSQTTDASASAAPLRHYLKTGSAAGIGPHPLFDPAWYRRTQMEEGDRTEALTHFLTRGANEKLDPNPLFSSAWYTHRYPDVGQSGQLALLHYLFHGGEELRDPHPAFSADAYIQQNPDCVVAGLSPLVHALSKDRPGSGRPVVLAGGSSLASVPKSSGPRTWQSRLDIPPHRRRLADLLFQLSGEESARRVIDYFSIIENLEYVNRSSGTLSRHEKLGVLVSYVRTLSEAAAQDSRPIEASVIIPVYNKVEYTLACVISLFESRNSEKFEVIVANDVSTDETQAVFEAVGGVLRCVTPENNGGFLRNCNFSAKHAIGKYLVLLNNDTIILDNWLDELLAPFGGFKNVGLVGSRLLNADGSLQEAGGIIWQDASGWNFGRNQDPLLPEYSYVRDADYVSGASIAIIRAAWNESGGFDERYIPAYYEDTDLAFVLRAKGLRTLYAPNSTLIHHEGVSHGTDTSTGLKAYQVANKAKFFDKWQNVLISEHYRDGEEVHLAIGHSRDRPHLLMIDHYIPQFDRDTGSRGMFEYCKIFVDAGFKLTFWPDNLYYDKEYARPLQDLGVEVLYGSHLVDKFPEWIEANGRYFEYVFLSRAHVSIKYIDDIKRHSDAKILFYGHDLNQTRLSGEYKITGREDLLREIDYWKDLEHKIWNKSDVVCYPAQDEVDFVRAEVGRPARLIPVLAYPDEELALAMAGVEREPLQPPSLMFVAGFRHRPNIDGALWLVREVLPRLSRRFPDLVTTIVGSFPPPEITRLASSNIVVTGYVSDPLLQRLYQSTSVVVAPLRFGAGVKGKIIEAMRFGVPVVTTTTGVQGLFNADSYLGIGDTADEFAERIAEFLEDRALRKKKIRAGLEYVVAEYSHGAFVRRMMADIPQLAQLLQGKGTLRRALAVPRTVTSKSKRRAPATE